MNEVSVFTIFNVNLHFFLSFVQRNFMEIVLHTHNTQHIE